MDLKCQGCLEADEDVRRFREVPAAGLLGGMYHLDCALVVGYNEWDEGN